MATQIILFVNSPEPDAVIYGPSLIVSGNASALVENPSDPGDFHDEPVDVTISVTGSESVTKSDVLGDWSEIINLTTNGKKTIQVVAKYGSIEKAADPIDVTVDEEAPTLIIDQPTQGQKIKGPGPDYHVTFEGTATDLSGIKSVQYSIDDVDNITEELSNTSNKENTWEWNESIKITVDSPGQHNIYFRACDNYNNCEITEQMVTIRDDEPPTIIITRPETSPYKMTWREGGVSVEVVGEAEDSFPGMQSVEWRLDDGAWEIATNVSGTWSEWRFTAEISAPGLHYIDIRATDGTGNTNEDNDAAQVQIDVAVAFDLEDVGFAAYLADLMTFTRRRVRTISNADKIEKELLKASYYQPFDRLTDNTFQSITTKPVAQVRIAVEVLRGFLDNTETQFPEYCEAAYRSLLANFGTSYAEIRLVRAAEPETRQALANRLGIAEAELNKLFLTPEEITESKLQTVFGLIDTTQEPLTLAVNPSELLTMQLSNLQSKWLEQDRNLDIPTPTIDPDIIGEEDLKSPVSEDAAYDLFKIRQKWVENQRDAIIQARESSNTPLEGIDHIVNLVLGDIDLLALEQAYADGEDIEPDLRDVQLDLGAFFRLLHIRKLADTDMGIVLDDEWVELYDILVQVQKQREFVAWADVEIGSGLTSGPGFFAPSGARPTFIPWRSTWRARRDWEKKLNARIKQQAALVQANQAAIDATEEAVLPLLRDLLIRTIDRGGYPDMDIADWLTQRLSISFKYSGDQRLSRLEQGVETLQDILLALRTGRLATLATLPVGTSVPDWELAVDDDYSEYDFDTEWQWMGSYATWRGAMFAFGYPENYLLPTLRDKTEWTKAFRQLLEAVRQRWRLTPNEAENLAAGYLENLNIDNQGEDGFPFDIELTSQLTKEQLRQRRERSKSELETYVDPQRGGLKPNTPPYLKEVFFFVPMLLALSLQKKGKYLASLDWYQTVYAYELPSDERKIYFGLEAEEALPTEFRRTFGWLLDGLDVFDIANDRANALTRFTLISIVRCYLAFADAEFTRETNESIPLARRLYITALKLLDLLEVPPAVAHWAFDTDEGTSASDITGNGHTATLYGIQWELIGWKGGAISFDGEDGFVEVPHAPALTLGKDGADFSVTFALYLREDATGEWRLLMRKGGRENNKERTPGMWLRPKDNHIHFRISTTTHWDEGSKSKSAVEIDTWTHIAYVKQGKSLKLYVNGRLDEETLLDGDSIGFEAPLFFGGTDALFDDVRVYDRALSADAVIALSGIDTFPANPVVNALRLHAELNLRKLRHGRNIAGMERVRTEPAAVELVAIDGVLAPPSPTSLKPTAYRYSALIERAKQFVTIAQQIEANFFAALEKRDAEAYNLLNAQHDVQLTKETVELQDLRILEADTAIVLMGLQQDRAQTQYGAYDTWINAGPNQYEREMLQNYKDMKDERNWLAELELATTLANAMVTANTAESAWSKGGAFAAAAALGVSGALRASAVKKTNQLEAEAQRNAFNANLERRKDEWALQRALASQDIDIAAQQIIQAQINEQIAEQERAIASMQADHAEALVEFLNNKFTNVELYEWMSDILSQVYSFFLQQATALAHLALNQLAFERQERPPAFIRSDYWQAPNDAAMQNETQEGPDRRGLTGSARLLQDIYQLDQYAFETNKRKLQLVEHFSLARLVPYEFQRFRETGVLPFATPMSHFDRGFPGHYLRLIKRVRVSVVGLIPPTEGIRASLSAAGVSRVITGGEVYRVTEVRRPPEMIAFTSPSNATGLFELQPENELLLPFETMGVDASWELQLPKAANRFNFNTIADVVFTVEYTALHSADYRYQVIQDLDHTFSAEQAYSFQQDFPDLWYHLHHPDALTVEDSGNIHAQFTIERSHFPPNLQGFRIDHVVLYFVSAEQADFEINVLDLRFDQDRSGNETSHGGATSMEGVISTRRANAASWLPLLGTSPVGEWTLVFPNTQEFKSLFEEEQIDDILFVVSYSGDTPPWPE